MGNENSDFHVPWISELHKLDFRSEFLKKDNKLHVSWDLNEVIDK